MEFKYVLVGYSDNDFWSTAERVGSLLASFLNDYRLSKLTKEEFEKTVEGLFDASAKMQELEEKCIRKGSDEYVVDDKFVKDIVDNCTFGCSLSFKYFQEEPDMSDFDGNSEYFLVGVGSSTNNATFKMY